MRFRLIPREFKTLDSFCGLRIWEKPKDGVQYTIGADVAEGVGGDASCAQVINIKNGVHVASFWSNSIDIDNFSAELYKLGHFYNRAQLCIEQNNHGNGVIAHLGGAIGALCYPNLYKRFTFDEFTQKRTKTIGFRTTLTTKPRIIENLKSALRDGELVTFDKYTIQELNNFVRDSRTGRMGSKGAAKDDRVMSLALGWESARMLRELSNLSEANTHFSEQTYDPATGFPL